MSTFTLRVGVDPEDLMRLRSLRDPNAALFPAMQQAHADSLPVLEYQAQDWMYGHFQNPTGRLESAFTQHVYGPFSSELWNDEPYAQRRNYGFSGMTDSLGRFYAYDPGIAWAENAVANSYTEVEQIWLLAFDRALGRI